MRLPEDRKERLKVFALIAIGAVAVAFTVAQLAVRPLFRSRSAKRQRIAELRGEMDAGRLEIARIDARRKELLELVQEIHGLSVSNVLQPVLGNYLLRATELVEKEAAQAGLQFAQLQEVGRADLPKGSRPGKLSYYSLRATLECGLAELIRLLETIEKANAYLCVADLSIMAQPPTPDRQKVNLVIQFPVWNSPDIAEQLERDLEQSLAMFNDDTNAPPLTTGSEEADAGPGDTATNAAQEAATSEGS